MSWEWSYVRILVCVVVEEEGEEVGQQGLWNTERDAEVLLEKARR
jgi:hypothetical protein